MTQPSDNRETAKASKTKVGIKAPLIFSAVLAVIAGFVIMIVSTGGLNNPDKPLRVDLGLITLGVTFIVSLLTISLMQLVAKDNPDELSAGSGINRSSQEIHRATVAKRRREAAAQDATKDDENPA